MDGRALSPKHALTSLQDRSETLLSFGLLGVLVVLLMPLPSVLLDMLLAANLAITILLLLITVSVTRPLDISVFPSLLLLLTLYRLSLNVATTRLILLQGDAGRIVSTFGGFVVGGNLGRRIGDLPDSDRDSIHRDHEGSGTGFRSGCPFHPGCHAGQADGYRRGTGCGDDR